MSTQKTNHVAIFPSLTTHQATIPISTKSKNPAKNHPSKTPKNENSHERHVQVSLQSNYHSWFRCTSEKQIKSKVNLSEQISKPSTQPHQNSKSPYTHKSNQIPIFNSRSQNPQPNPTKTQRKPTAQKTPTFKPQNTSNPKPYNPPC